MFKNNQGKLSLFGLSFLVLVAILAVITASIITSPSQKQDLRSKAAPSSRLYFYPETLSLIGTPPSDQSVNIMVNPSGNRVTAAEIHLTFDPTKVNIKNIIASSLFSSVLTTPVINNQLGTADFTVGVPAGNNGSSAVSETASIATVYLTNTQTGSSTINFTNQTQAAALNELGNVITTLTPLNIVVQTPTPSPTPIPKATISMGLKLQKTTGKLADIPVLVTITNTDNQELFSQNVNFTSDNFAVYHLTLTDLLIKTVTIKIKPKYYLTKKNTPVALVSGSQILDLTQTPFLAADIHENNKIDIFDYNKLVEDYGPNMPPGGSPADFDKNGKVDLFDYNTMVENFAKVGD